MGEKDRHYNVDNIRIGFSNQFRFISEKLIGLKKARFFTGLFVFYYIKAVGPRTGWCKADNSVRVL